ncbi:glyoxalase superfamily protein [Streptomyces sp. A3M-1-3]|uniref:VOC family protein n=1 Tax=Streptomyces sp. A3M-1-3 TaxID=2962044 RepID=UPI0020B6E697|nr:VOC family protein [Streptomyces sp. A3M-1-3]MCP3822688.1 glyoxalase superfamily protein [Streptomyces sp. A3M-1-3]
MNITHSRFVTLPVADQDRAKDFYVNTLGFEVLIDQQAGPIRWIQVGPKGAQTSFVLATAEMGFTPGSAKGIMLETSALDADCAQLVGAGVTVEGPEQFPWGRQANLTDPDGNTLTLAAAQPNGS